MYESLGHHLVDLKRIATLLSWPDVFTISQSVDVVSPDEHANINPNELFHEGTVP